MKCEHYSTPADVYSYAVVLWELITLKSPYPQVHNFRSASFAILADNVRPSVSFVSNSAVRAVLESSWQVDSKSRPTFSQIKRELAQLPQEPQK